MTVTPWCESPRTAVWTKESFRKEFGVSKNQHTVTSETTISSKTQRIYIQGLQNFQYTVLVPENNRIMIFCAKSHTSNLTVTSNVTRLEDGTLC